MAIPDIIIENIEVRVSCGKLLAYLDGRMLGRVETIDGKIAIFPAGKNFRSDASILSWADTRKAIV